MRSPFELQSLIDWLEKQPADTKYSYTSCCNCLNAQYLEAIGFSVGGIGASFWYSTDLNLHKLPKQFDEVALKGEYTFGAALSRARALLSS